MRFCFYFILFLFLEVIVMAYVAPTIRSVGDAVTAADYNIMANNALQFAPFVQGVFTNEAARDAAITSPTEGMHVYLTAPTVPAATGATTILPSGIETVYNGSVWVCVTPVAAYNDTPGTTSSSSWTTTLSGGGTNVSVTLVTGTSALLSLHVSGYNNNLANSTSITISVSGATTIAAGSVPLNGRCNSAINGQVLLATTTRVISGLTAGTNTFTMNYIVSGGTSGGLYERSLIAQGIA